MPVQQVSESRDKDEVDLLQPGNDFHRTAKGTEVPRRLGHTKKARKDCLSLLVGGRGHQKVSHPRPYLLRNNKEGHVLLLLSKLQFFLCYSYLAEPFDKRGNTCMARLRVDI